MTSPPGPQAGLVGSTIDHGVGRHVRGFDVRRALDRTGATVLTDALEHRVPALPDLVVAGPAGLGAEHVGRTRGRGEDEQGAHPVLAGLGPGRRPSGEFVDGSQEPFALFVAAGDPATEHLVLALEAVPFPLAL